MFGDEELSRINAEKRSLAAEIDQQRPVLVADLRAIDDRIQRLSTLPATMSTFSGILASITGLFGSRTTPRTSSWMAIAMSAWAVFNEIRMLLRARRNQKKS